MQTLHEDVIGSAGFCKHDGEISWENFWVLFTLQLNKLGMFQYKDCF